jgi:hypothetical protein
MSQLPPTCLFLAEGNPFKGLSGGFKPGENQQGPDSVILVLVGLLAFVVLLWLVARIAERRRERGPSNSPLLLFFSLCRAHGLSWSEGYLLWRVARRHRLEDPARVFLEPERLDPAGIGPAGKSRARRLQALKDRLFAGLAGAESQGANSPLEQAHQLGPETSDPESPFVQVPLTAPSYGGDDAYLVR